MCESFRSFPQGLNFWGKCEMSSEVKARVPTRSSVKGANKHEVSVTGWGHQLCWLNMSLQRCTLTTLSVHSKICPPSQLSWHMLLPQLGRAPCLLCHRCLAMSTPIQGCSLPLEHVPCKCLSVEPPVADAIERVTGAGVVAPGGAPESHQLVRGDT